MGYIVNVNWLIINFPNSSLSTNSFYDFWSPRTFNQVSEKKWLTKNSYYNFWNSLTVKTQGKEIFWKPSYIESTESS